MRKLSGGHTNSKKCPPSQKNSSSDKTSLHLPCLIQPTDLQSYHWCPLWYLSLATGHTLCKINKHKNKQIKNQWVSVYQNPENCKWLPLEHLILFPRLVPLTSVKFSLHWPATSLRAHCGCFNVKAIEPCTFSLPFGGYLFVFNHLFLQIYWQFIHWVNHFSFTSCSFSFIYPYGH